MAFVPTAADFGVSQPDKKKGFTPTAADFGEPAQQSPGFLQQLGSQAARLPGQIGGEIARDPMQAILNLGGATGKALFAPVSGLESLAGKGLSALGIPGGETLQRMGSAGLGGAPGFRPGLTPALSQIPESALLAASVPSGISAARALPGLAKGLAGKFPGAKLFTQRGADESATKFTNSLLKGEDLGSAHKPIIDEIRKDYSTNVSSSKKNYKNALNAIRDSGYSKQVAKDPTAALGLGRKSGKIVRAPEAIKDIGDLDIKQVRFKNALNDFQDNPSFDAAHNLQSVMGKVGAKMKSSPDSLISDQGAQILSARRTLQGEMLDSLKKSGDSGAHKLYQKATDFHRENVAPYVSENTLRKITKEKGLKEINPQNIHNILKKDQGAINAVKDNLSRKSKDLIVAKALDPFKGPDGLVNSKELINRYFGLKDKGFGEFMNKGHEEAVRNILKTRRRTQAAQTLGGLGGITTFEELLRRNVL